jgi:hypothetical protein
LKGYDVGQEALQRARDLLEREGVPAELAQELDADWRAVAPSAPPRGDGIEQLLEVLSRYTISPRVRVHSTRPRLGWVVRLVKRVLGPVQVVLLRHVTDQINAFHVAETEILRELVSAMRKAER